MISNPFLLPWELMAVVQTKGYHSLVRCYFRLCGIHISISLYRYIHMCLVYKEGALEIFFPSLEEYFYFILQVRNVRNIPYIMPYCARVNAYQRHVIICHIVLHLAMV